MKNQYLKVSEARKSLKEWDWVPESSVRKALNNHLIPHMKSGQGTRAWNLVRVEDLKRYFLSLKHE